MDNININLLNKNSIRKNIALVNQFPYIFNSTIRENLLMAKDDATEEELINACKLSNSWEFISNYETGLDTIVGEGGIKLSGGQKQRIAIARAILKDSRIIIFDESTSSLDNKSQDEIRKSINLLKDKTVIIAAHRLSTVRDADDIIFMENGEIIDHGTFDDLFVNNEKFSELFTYELIE